MLEVLGGLIIIGIGVAVVVFLFRETAHQRRQARQQQQDCKRFYEDKDRARAQFQEKVRERAVRMLEELQIQDRATSPLLHEPIYDCATDDFKLPCCHDNFAELFLLDSRPPGGHIIGWFNGCEEVRKTLDRFVSVSQSIDYEQVAVVGNRHYLAVLWEVEAGHPGGTVWRLVRTGECQWYGYSWKAGFRPSAADLDPPFHVKDFIRNPELWDQRERNTTALRRANRYYQSALRACSHRKAS